MTEATIMQDGTEAWLTSSGNYYCRRYRLTPKLKRKVPTIRGWNGIDYYTLDGAYIPLASATCSSCQTPIQSLHCGDFVTCPCGRTSVDTDRWFPERHRMIGAAA